MYDDVAWDEAGSPPRVDPAKHHRRRSRHLGDSSPDLWQTMLVWLNSGRPTDPSGPVLTLVTTSIASADCAAFALRDRTDLTGRALALLEAAA